MRVLHVDTGREMRGGQWQALYLMQGLIEQGIECQLLTRETAPLRSQAADSGVETGKLTPLRLREWSLSADVVHAHDAAAHTVGALWSRSPLVVSRRVAFPVRRGVASRWKYARAALYLAVSRAVAADLLSAGVPAGRIRIVHDAVPAGLSPSRRRGGVVALDSRDPLKGKAIIEAAGVPVEFTRNLLEALQEARVFLYVTENEGLGSAALLALAHGVPVIASRVGGLPEVVRHGETGLLLDQNEPALVRDAVLRLLEDATLAARLGEAGRRLVAEEFSLAKMVAGTISAYQEVAGT